MQLEVYFDFVCPYAYLAASQLPGLSARSGVVLHWRPMLLGGVFRAIGQRDFPVNDMPPAKARHQFLDMHRWAEALDVPFAMPAEHPRRTVLALRTLLALPENAWPQVILPLFQAYWVHGCDVTRPEEIAAVLTAAGLSEAEAREALVRAEHETTKAALRTRTDEAVARGVFGAPTFFIGGHMFWGQDRLALVERVAGGLSLEGP